MRAKLSLGLLALAAPSIAPAQAPVEYTENLGQWPAPVRFRAQAGPLTTWLVDGGWVAQAEERDGDGIRGVAVRMTLDGAGAAPRAVVHTRRPGVRHYLRGEDRSRWATHVPGFARVRYDDAFPGVDVVLREQGGVVEYDLIVAPGADLRAAVLRCEGHDRLSLADDGSLVIHTRLGEPRQKPPRTWATLADGTRQPVKCSYALLDADRYGFRADAWPAGTELTIDPGLLWSSFLGGSGSDSVRDVDVAANGDVVVVGTTQSTDYPTTAGAYQRAYVGGYFDGFVTRFRAGGRALAYATYFGSDHNDSVEAVAIASDDSVWVTGSSPSTSFPTTADRFQGPQGRTDAFVARLDASGARLLFSTMFGADSTDAGHDLWLDETNKLVYICGTSLVKDSSRSIPITPNAFQSQRPGWQGAFLTVFDFSKSSKPTLRYSTYFGNSGTFADLALHVDARGVATVGGSASYAPDMPVTANAHRRAPPSSAVNLFVSRFDIAGSGPSSLLYSSYLGAASGNLAERTGVHADGSGVITLGTLTSAKDWPTTANALQPTFGGQHDGVVARIDTAKSGQAALVYSTFVGGSAREYFGGLDVGAGGIVTVGLSGVSTTLPTTPGAFQPWARTSQAGYVMQLDTRPSTPTLAYASYGPGYRARCCGVRRREIDR